MSAQTDIFGQPVGETSTHTEYGNRMLRDTVFGKRGSVERTNGFNGHDGAYYAGGPKVFEPVERTVTTIVGPWEARS